MAFSVDKKAKKVVFIINPPKTAMFFPPEFFPKLVSWALENCDIYAYILHDLDFNEDGTQKRQHVHMYCEFKACKRVLTNINALADWLEYDTAQISAQVASSNPAGFFQYLIHKNNPDKHQYEAKDIISNLESGEIEALLNADAGNCSIERIVECCKRYALYSDLIRELGLDVYTKYHRAIDNLHKQYFGR